jgi:hypothetical protein
MHEPAACRGTASSGGLPTIVGQMTLCALCRRNLLAGERFRYWENAEERHVARVVCHLCEPTATRDGWARTDRNERENAVGLRGTVRLVA